MSVGESIKLCTGVVGIHHRDCHGDGTVGIIRKVIIISIYRIHRFVCMGMDVTIAIGRVSVAADGDLWDALVVSLGL